MTPRRPPIKRPPEPRQVGGKYAALMGAILRQWSARVTVLGADGLDRAELEQAWAHLTDPKMLRPILARLALTIDQDNQRYFARTFKGKYVPRPDLAQQRARWVDDQIALLADQGRDQIDRLLQAQAEHRSDAKASVTRSVNQARKANVALIGGTDLGQHVKLIDLFKNAQAAGVRHESLPVAIQDIMGIGLRRAKLIARDQTVKHNAATNEAQARAAGFTQYTWRITRDDSCRPMHKALEGTVHRYDNPPITNKEGDRNNPGEDFNCRCLAEPLPNETQDLFAGLGDPTFEGLGF